jgi:hypothetical protein
VIRWVEATRDVLDMEAKFLHHVEPARAGERLMSRFVRSHETAGLSVRSVKSDRTPGGSGVLLPRR